jgi:DNA polymerase (family 10)
LHQILDDLAALATIRGDAAEAALLERATQLVTQRQIVSEADLEPLFAAPAAPADAEAAGRLRQIHETCGWVLVESGLADIPADLRWLYESGAMTIAQLAVMHRALGATSAADFAAAAENHRIRSVDGLNAEIETAVANALPQLRRRIPRIPLGRAVAAVDPMLAAARGLPDVAWAETTGSLRRGRDTVGDVEVIVASDRPAGVIEALTRDLDIMRWLHRSERRAYVLADRIQIGIRVATPSRAAAELLYLTGSVDHLEALRDRAASRGWRLSPTGLVGSDGSVLVSGSEAEIYRALDLPFIPPEIREGEDEVDAAARGALPALVTRADIRGDLHMHTMYSDGRDSVEAMVEMCHALGYEYVAITDHSPHSASSRNLSADSVRRQADEIAGLRQRYPGMAILHGCEVDILPDGSLDFPDRILEQFDIVLASLHDRAGQDSPHLLARYLRAMQHPLVHAITHPTNRLVGQRPGYDLDYERLFDAAVQTRTIVEIDGSPAHLDLDGTLARLAIEAGATVCIDSDSHRDDVLQRQMGLGLLMARRGWVEARHVVNTRPIDAVRQLLASKRGA